MPKKIAVIDGNSLMHRAYHAVPQTMNAPDGRPTNAVFGFIAMLLKFIDIASPDALICAFDAGRPAFRMEALEQYKSQRPPMDDDLKVQFPIIEELLEAMNVPVVRIKGWEGDDVLGTIAARDEELGYETLLVTGDKDAYQLATDMTRIVTTKKGITDVAIYGPAEVLERYGVRPDQFIDFLGLKGDSSDNIPGCPGVGEKTAQKLIAQYGSIENLLSHTDELKGALKTKVETNRKMIEFSKFLATIKIDVPITLNMDELKREEPDEEELRKIFEEMEFRTLIDRVFNREKKTASAGATSMSHDKAQGSLFGDQPSLFDQPSTSPSSQASSQGNLFAEFEDENTGNGNYSNLACLENSKYDYQLIDTEEKRAELIQKLLTKETFSLDTETTGTDPITAKLVGMSFSYTENQAFYVPVPAEQNEAQKIVNEFRPVFEKAGVLKVGQNIKYDMLVLGNYGVEVCGPLFDTMVAHYVLQPELRHNMDYLAEIYLHYQTIHIEELIGPKGKGQKNMRDLPPEAIYKYACEDADVTLKLKHALEKELKEQGAEKLFYEIEMPLVPVLVYMERNGVRVDTEALKQTSEHFTARMNQIEEEVHQLAGTEFNIASPKQVGEVLFDKLRIVEKAKKTKTGQYVTSEEVLESLRGKHEIVGKILEHRGLKKLLGTYIDALPLLINPATGKIHTSFNQTVTATGRLSSSNPNLQNIPIRNEDGKEIRKAFIPEDGCEFFSADYSQIELRIMAHLSGDKNMIEAFREGDDIHAATAAKVYKIAIEDVTREQRSKAKTANFGIIYGISVFGLAERMNVPRQEAKELIDGYFDTYPQIKEYMDKSIERARANGYIETIFGRKRFLPDINSRNAVVRGYAERNAINAPIQGSAADIIKVAMVKIFQRFQSESIRSKMILQVHDELNFSVVPEEKEKVQQIVMEEMEKAYLMQVPLKADCGWGNNWLEAH